MARATVTLPQDLLTELMSLVGAKSKTEAVLTAVRDEIRLRKTARIKAMAGRWSLSRMLMNYDMETTALAKVLVDTSVWIEFFRKQEPCFGVVTRLIDEEQVCCTGSSLPNLCRGQNLTKSLPCLPISRMSSNSCRKPRNYGLQPGDSPSISAAKGRLSVLPTVSLPPLLHRPVSRWPHWMLISK